MTPGQKFSVAPGTFAICRLPAAAVVPPWASGAGDFTSVTRTEEEVSIVCEEARVPALEPEGFRREGGFALIKLHGPFPLDAIGILASVAKPLAEAGISLLAIGTFDTDYLLVKRAHVGQAVATLTRAGHVLADR
ncbi:MAG: ACT domain-containing protein [Thermoanaerobaculia bacterium]